ncbi:TetR/AcrR family transcriptional regulator [Paracoccus ravus]|uniref:TetR/AcrR family transcriptional regulator n=1 Tax=Paracoccus ravus TaxID=2447760 RepID=UPI003CC8BD02
MTAGRDLVLRDGFLGMGLSRLLAVSHVPKGSFYHYFASKEAFGCALLTRYVDDYLTRLDEACLSCGNAREKLDAFWNLWLADNRLEAHASKCLVVKLGAEVADLSEDMRQILDKGVAQLTGRLAALLREGGEDGSVRRLGDPDGMAQLIYAQWLGASILAKLSRSDVPLRAAMADSEVRLAPTDNT